MPFFITLNAHPTNLKLIKILFHIHFDLWSYKDNFPHFSQLFPRLEAGFNGQTPTSATILMHKPDWWQFVQVVSDWLFLQEKISHYKYHSCSSFSIPILVLPIQLPHFMALCT